MKILLALLLAWPLSAAWAGEFTDLNSPDPEIRSDACLASIDSEEEVDPLLLDCLDDESLLVRHCAAYALARRGGAAAAQAFREGLSSPDYDRRRISALGLGMLGGGREVDFMKPLLTDGNWEVRWAAAYALGRSGRREALPWLKHLAAGDPHRDERGNYPVRTAAARAAERLEASVGWHRRLADAVKAGKEGGRPLIVHLRQAGNLCSRYEQAIFTDERVVDALQRTVPVWLDRGSSPKDFELLQVQRLPALVCLAPSGQVISRTYGVLAPEVFQEKVLAALEKSDSPSRLRRNLAENPNDLECAWQLVEVYLEEGRLEGARSLCREIIKRDPDNVSSLLDNAVFTEAYVLGRCKDYSASAAALKDMLESFPFSGERARALYCLGLALYKSGLAPEGQKVLRRLIREYPSSRLAAAASSFLAPDSAR